VRPIVRAKCLASNGAIEVGGLDLKMERAEWDEKGLRIVMRLPDRETGEWHVATYESTFVRPPRDEEELAMFITAAVSELLAHEVAERILVHGRRVLDPHVRGMPVVAWLASGLRTGDLAWSDERGH
jgi:hypothetical protein